MKLPPKRRHLFVAHAVTACFLVGTATPLAHAETASPQEASAAQALFERGVEEMKQKQYATACPKLEEVTRILPDAIGAKMALADCYEQSERSASAWMQWSTVASLAGRAGQRDRQLKASQRAETLRKKLAKLTVTVSPEARAHDGLVVKRDGVEIGKAQWDTPIPVDTGDHEIVAAAAGRETFTVKVHVARDGETSAVTVPALAADTSAAKASAPQEAEAPSAPPRDREEGGAGSWRRPLGIGSTVAGGAGLIVGSVLGIMAISKKGASNGGGDLCDANDQCGAEGLHLREQASGFATGSTIAFAAGGALMAGGVVLWLTAPRSSERASIGATRVEVGAGRLLLQGTF